MLQRSALALLLSVVLAACTKKSVDPDLPGADAGTATDSGSRADSSLPADAGPPLPSSGRITAAEGGALQSPDGVFVLFIPPGALAADTDVSVTALARAEWPAETAEATPLADVYDLQPDGLTFTTPALAIHRLPPRAPALLSPGGDPMFAFHHVRNADGTIEIVSTETFVFEAGSAVIGQISHLSAHWASTDAYGAGPTLTARVVADAGRHAVDTQWLASDVSLQTAGSLSMLQVRTGSHARTTGSGPVAPVNHAGWESTFDEGLGGTSFIPDLPTRSSSALSPQTAVAVIDAATPFRFPMPLPGWRCLAPADPGTSVIWISIAATVQLPGSLAPATYTLETEIGTPDCITRDEKPEYVAQRMMLGDARVAPLVVPGMSTTNLADTAGSFGHLVTVAPGATIRVCVTASMPTAVTYFPRFHPGYTFVDVAPPGCTEITNLDGTNPNDVLIVIEGAGSPNNVTVTTTQL